VIANGTRRIVDGSCRDAVATKLSPIRFLLDIGEVCHSLLSIQAAEGLRASRRLVAFTSPGLFGKSGHLDHWERRRPSDGDFSVYLPVGMATRPGADLRFHRRVVSRGLDSAKELFQFLEEDVRLVFRQRVAGRSPQ